MNILPKNYKEFLSKDYWDKFFREVKKQNTQENFEWYGNYNNFSSVLEKVLDPNETILNIGCGNSLFSEDLHDNGFKKIVNVDFSESVVKEMAKRSEKLRPQMKYEVGDIFDMKYEAQSFDTIIDKGCLDAVFPEDDPQIEKNVLKMFDDIIKISKKRYVFISLCQEHILNSFLKYFAQYQLDIHEILIEKSKMHPFLVIVSFKEPGCINLHLKGHADVLKVDAQECIKQIQKIQVQNNFVNSIKKFSLGQRFIIDIWDSKNPELTIPRYSLIICDSSKQDVFDKKICGCFVSSQLNYNGWAYTTQEGNLELLNLTGLSRIIIAVLNPGNKYISLKDVQNELSPVMLDIIPNDCKNKPVPFMSDGSEFGGSLINQTLEKDIIYMDNEMIVEECRDSQNIIRRLILKENIKAIQSQFKIIPFNQKNQEKAYLKDLQEMFKTPVKKGFYYGIDENDLLTDVHRTIVAGFSLAPEFDKNDYKILILGSGINVLGKFIQKHFKHVSVTNVEKSKKIIELSKQYFETTETQNFKIINKEATEYLSGLQAGELFDMIILDIDGKDELESPPQQFQTPEFFQRINERLVKGNGVFMMKFMSKQTKQLESIQQNINQTFKLVYQCQLIGEMSEIIIARNAEEQNITVDNIKPIKKHVSSIFNHIKQLEELIGEIKIIFPLQYQQKDEQIQDKSEEPKDEKKKKKKKKK